MANYATLKAAIQNVIKTNGNNEITGALLQQSLLAMVNSLGADYLFVGVAYPSTNPGTPDQNVFYIAASGTYPNFGGTNIPNGSIGLFLYNGTWDYQIVSITNVETGEINYDYIDGIYIDVNGNPVDFWNGASTDFIPASKGDIFYITGAALYAIHNVVGYDANKNKVRDLFYQPSGTFTDHEIQITTDDIFFVRASSKLNETHSFKKLNVNSIPYIKEEIAALKNTVDNLGLSDVITDDLTNGIDGYYINQQGQIRPLSVTGYKEFDVKAGAIIDFSAYVAPAFSAIAKKISNDEYVSLVNPVTGYQIETFHYVADEDMTIAVSYYLDIARSIRIETSILQSHSKNIEILQNDVLSINNNALIQANEFGFMFSKIAVIGDSLASGRVEGIVGQPDAVGADFYNFSWLSFLSKRWRCAAFMNYSNAGATTASWIANWLPIMQADTTIYDAYFIALGTNNEYNESGSDEANKQAFITRYKSIVSDVRSKAPNAVIFLMSLYEKRAGNETLEDIAADLIAPNNGIFYIDFANESKYLRYSPEVNWRGHFSSTGYVYVASEIDRLVNEIVWNNQESEFWQQFAKYHNNS